MFFINAEYPSFREHGLGKAEKSPKSFEPFSDIRIVQRRGRMLDRLDIVGTRSDIDVSDALVAAWINSCNSDDPTSVGTLIRRRTDPALADVAVLQCIQVANRGSYDFIWQTIAPEIQEWPLLSPLAADFGRKLADLYAEIMSLTLAAIETTPSIATEGRGVSSRSLGHLGVFYRILGHIGLDIRALRSEEMLLRVLATPELALIRRLHALTLQAANKVQDDLLDYWRALQLAENRARLRRLTHREMKAALTSSFRALGLYPDESYLKKILQIELALENRFLSHFKSEIERMMFSTDEPYPLLLPSTSPYRKQTVPRDILLFASADPSTTGSSLAKLALDREFKEIRSALEALYDKCQISIWYEPAFEIRDLQPALLKANPRYFHFSGHGTKHGEILVEGGKTADLVRIGPIARALELIASRIECAVFNACFSETAIAEIGDKINYAVLMSDAVGDEAAIKFAASFYGALGAGLKIPRAFAIACNAIELFGLPQSDVPRLFRRGTRVTKLP